MFVHDNIIDGKTIEPFSYTISKGVIVMIIRMHHKILMFIKIAKSFGECL